MGSILRAADTVALPHFRVVSTWAWVCPCLSLAMCLSFHAQVPFPILPLKDPGPLGILWVFILSYLGEVYKAWVPKPCMTSETPVLFQSRQIVDEGEIEHSSKPGMVANTYAPCCSGGWAGRLLEPRSSWPVWATEWALFLKEEYSSNLIWLKKKKADSHHCRILQQITNP